jgi:hypothetical protein
MKCIKATKATKNTEVGTIIRLGDADAETRVKSGYWQYAAKSEWKSLTKPKIEKIKE